MLKVRGQEVPQQSVESLSHELIGNRVYSQSYTKLLPPVGSEKVMFSVVSVNLSIGGGVYYPMMHRD